MYNPVLVHYWLIADFVLLLFFSFIPPAALVKLASTPSLWMCLKSLPPFHLNYLRFTMPWKIFCVCNFLSLSVSYTQLLFLLISLLLFQLIAITYVEQQHCVTTDIVNIFYIFPCGLFLYCGHFHIHHHSDSALKSTKKKVKIRIGVESATFILNRMEPL